MRPGGYKGRDYQVEGDASGASYFWALAAIGGGEVTVENLGLESIQGDRQFTKFYSGLKRKKMQPAERHLSNSRPEP